MRIIWDEPTPGLFVASPWNSWCYALLYAAIHNHKLVGRCVGGIRAFGDPVTYQANMTFSRTQFMHGTLLEAMQWLLAGTVSAINQRELPIGAALPGYTPVYLDLKTGNSSVYDVHYDTGFTKTIYDRASRPNTPQSFLGWPPFTLTGRAL